MYLVCLHYSIRICVCVHVQMFCASRVCLLANLVALCGTQEQEDKDYQAGSFEEFIIAVRKL